MPSPIETVAEHEEALMRQVAGAEQEARRLVEEAREEAAAITRSQAELLNADLTRARAEAALERKRLCGAIADAAERETERIRADIAGGVDGVKAEVLRLILPAMGEGDGS